MARVIIFGLQDFASLAHFYLSHDSEHEVAAFTVTQDYLPADPVFEGKPVVPFEGLEQALSPRGLPSFRADVAAADEPAPRRDLPAGERRATDSSATSAAGPRFSRRPRSARTVSSSRIIRSSPSPGSATT